MDFTIGRFTLRIQFSFFLLFMILFLKDIDHLLMPALFSILLHEMGHCLAMWRLGVPVRLAELDCMGIHIQRGEGMLSVGREAWVHLAGPLVNLLLAGGCSLWLSSTMQRDYFIALNLLLCMIHLLPVGNLDGANLLHLVTNSLFEMRTAQRVQRGISQLVLLGGLFWLLYHHTRVNFTFLILWCYLLYSTYKDS